MGFMIYKKGWGEPPERQEMDSLHGLQQDQPYNMTPVLSPRTSEDEVATCSDGAAEICFSSSRELRDTHLLLDSACDTQVGLVWQEP